MFALASLGFSMASISESYQADKPAPDATEAGLHLLSCPELFEHNNEASDETFKNLRLSLAASDLLMGALKTSMRHARVVHTGNTNKKNPGHFATLSQAISEQIGLGAEQAVDVNVPRRSDNTHLCDVLKKIVEENPAKEEESNVTISILKLERRESSSVLLRGAKMVIEHPLFDQVVIKLSSLDHALRDALSSIHETVHASIPEFHLSGLDGEVLGISAEA
jgi:hypothetical protein